MSQRQSCAGDGKAKMSEDGVSWMTEGPIDVPRNEVREVGGEMEEKKSAVSIPAQCFDVWLLIAP